MISAVTNSIRVSVHASFDGDMSIPETEQYFFSYAIHIKNEGDQEVQLLRRRWVINDLFIGQRIVEGEGVVGEQPVLLPGQEHTYTSACMLHSPSGFMHGHYLFENINNGETMLVKIPKFELELPFQLN